MIRKLRRLREILEAFRWAIKLGVQLESITVRQWPNHVSKTPSRVFHIHDHA